MVESKKNIFKNVLLILIGFSITLFIENSKNWLTISLLITGAIVAGLNLIYFFINLQFFLDDIFPTNTFDEKSKTKIDKSIILTVNILFFISAILIIFEIDKIDNTIQGVNFFCISGVIGLLISILIIVTLKRISKTIYNDSTRRYTILLGIPIGLLMLFPAIASFTNRQLSNKETICYQLSIESKSMGARSRTPYLYLKVHNNIERFVVSRALYEEIREDKKVELCVGKGLFGFEFTKELKLAN